MISKADILRMVTHVHRHNRGVPPRRLIHPVREWGIGVLATIIIVAVSAGYGMYLYRSIDSLNGAITPSPVNTVRYNTTAVERALEQYQERAAQTARIAQSALVVPVPEPTSATTSVATSSTPTRTPPVTASTTNETDEPASAENGAPELAV